MIHEQIEKWVMSEPSVEEAERKLDKAGVPSLRVRSLVELANDDEQIKAREMMPRVYQPFIGSMKMYGSPLKLSETPAGIRGYGPFLGEHNRDVLGGFLGYSGKDIDTFYQEDILFHEEAVNRLPEELEKINK